MDSFYRLFTRYLAERAERKEMYVVSRLTCHKASNVPFYHFRDWDRMTGPAADDIVSYSALPEAPTPKSFQKLAVLKVNGGLGTSMGAYIRLAQCSKCRRSFRYDWREERFGGQARHDVPRSHCPSDRALE